MFPRFREQIGTALDLIVEFSTLGEYRLALPGAPGAPAVAPVPSPRLGGAGGNAERAAVRVGVAGGRAGTVPVATPAARRGTGGRPGAARPGLRAHALESFFAAGGPARPHATRCRGERRNADKRTAARTRAGAAPALEQLCLAV
jgi:hypothetical protein